MKRIKDSLELSASDLVGYLNCRHLSKLDRAVAEGDLAKPKLGDNPLLQLLGSEVPSTSRTMSSTCQRTVWNLSESMESRLQTKPSLKRLRP